MHSKLPAAVLYIMSALTKSGYTAQIVGGAVRDLFLDIPTSDWDVTTNATPEQVLPLFDESFYENTFGTVMIAQKHLQEQFGFPADTSNEDLIFDITTYRSDGEYRNHRQPETVTWGTSIEEDLTRRDFTINAMALEIVSMPQFTAQTEYECETRLIDPFNGKADLDAKRIVTVGEPMQRFNEDALRMLRAVRFSAQLGMQIDQSTYEAITTLAPTLAHISEERIGAETLKILASQRAKEGILNLDSTGLLSVIIPELIETKGVKQSGHHIYDVWEHSLNALESCPSTDPVVRLATLIHDIAKPQTYKETGDGSVTFYNHEVIGARMAKQIARRLRLGKDDCDRVFTLVRWHMFTYEKDVTDAYIRRFIRRVGVENINDMIALRTGDRVGSGSKPTSWRLEELQQRVYDQLHQPLQLTDMAINGKDVMEYLSITPGPQVGMILQELFEDVLDTPEHNNREYLVNRLDEYKG